MSTTSQALIRTFQGMNPSTPITAGQLLAVIRELNAFEDSIDPDGDPGTVKADTITEYTEGNGTVIDNDALVDGTLEATGALTAQDGILTDTITERTADAGVTVEGVTLKDDAISGATNVSSDVVTTDIISELSVNTGVTIDAVLLKDGAMTTGSPGTTQGAALKIGEVTDIAGANQAGLAALGLTKQININVGGTEYWLVASAAIFA